jgi:hypothetical protein
MWELFLPHPVLAREGLQPDCAGEAQQQLLITDPPSRHRGRPIITNPQLSKDNFKEKIK